MGNLQADHQRKKFTGRNAKPPFPQIKGTERVGDLTTTNVANRGGIVQHWRFNGQTWSKITPTQFKTAQNEARKTRQNYDTLVAGNISDALRYPNDIVAEDTDYVLFEFYEYKPPFQGISKDTDQSGLAQYNQSATDAAFYERTNGIPSVVLYMPEDVSTGYKANWSGKSFSNVGRDIMATVGSNLKDLPGNFEDSAKTMINQAIPMASTSLGH